MVGAEDVRDVVRRDAHAPVLSVFQWVDLRRFLTSARLKKASHFRLQTFDVIGF